MEAKELRISNWVNYLDLPIQVDGIDDNIDVFNRQTGEIPVHCIFPIPLNEEWLLKFGFEKSVENAGNLPCYKRGKYTIAKWIGGKYQFWIKTVDIYNSPQYVHQLQNLFFALTGEELKIEPKTL